MSGTQVNPSKESGSGPSPYEAGVDLGPIQQVFIGPSNNFTNVFKAPGDYNISIGFSARSALVLPAEEKKSKIPRPTTVQLPLQSKEKGKPSRPGPQIGSRHGRMAHSSKDS